jgi:hypothetical protein
MTSNPSRALALAFLAACGRINFGPPYDSAVPVLAVPDHHRPDDSACATPPPPGNCSVSSAMNQCMLDTNCTSGLDGRCIETGPPAPPFCICSYAGCMQDTDCSLGGPCDCAGPGGYGCVPGNCQIDADCGTGGYCSPSNQINTTGCGGFAGYFCHTIGDECTNDSTCPGATPNGQYYCVFDASLRHWKCEYQPACA